MRYDRFVDSTRAWGGALGVCLLAAACSKPAPAPEPVRAVKVVTVGVSAAQSSVTYAGEVRARVESALGFRVGGKLVARAVDAGQRVRAGQLLARLDAADLALAQRAAQAQIDAAQTSLDLAQADFSRYQSLHQQGFIGGAELDRRQSALKAAQAQLTQAQAQAAVQGHQLGYADLRADAPGVVTAVLAQTGQVVGAGVPVLQLAHDGDREVQFAVPEDKVAALRVGSAVAVRPWMGSQDVSARVREVAASADPVTRTFSARASLPPGLDWPLGSTVSVQPAILQHVGQAVLTLPTSALHRQQQGTAVWVLDPARMTVHAQPVQVATADGNDVVIASGLTPGAQVVVAGVHVLAEGQVVKIYQEKMPPALTSPAQTAIQNVASVEARGAPAASAPGLAAPAIVKP